MLWCYRLSEKYVAGPFTISMADVKKMALDGAIDEAMVREIAVLLRQAQAFWATLGWDGSMATTKVFTVPGRGGSLYGFTARDAGSGSTYIASPINLPHLGNTLDWDAQVSTKTIEAARNAIVSGEVAATRPAPRHKGWKISARGNFYTEINGIGCTVYSAGDDWKAVLNPIGRKPVHTPAFRDEHAAQYYVEEHFYEIIDPPKAPRSFVAPDEWDDEP